MFICIQIMVSITSCSVLEQCANFCEIIKECEKKAPKDLSDNVTIVTFAYLAALLPWTVMANFDFISAKWRTIRDTRNHGCFHLIACFLPLPYLCYYVHLQRMSEDYKEMMAAILAILMCFYHAVRSSWGLIQLRAFHDWCLDMKSMLSEHYPESMQSIAEEISVNESIIDNEISGSDIEMSFRLPSLDNTVGGMNGFWDAVKSIRARDFLKCHEEQICTIRWTALFLCSEFCEVFALRLSNEKSAAVIL